MVDDFLPNGWAIGYQDLAQFLDISTCDALQTVLIVCIPEAA